MAEHKVGYIRVSSIDQNTDRQLEGLTLDKVFIDKASGKDIKRPELEKLIDFVRKGDTIVVHSMDRLARNLDDLRRLVQGLTQRGVRIEFVKENLIFTGENSPMANLMLSVMGAFAEFERALILERQREGIALAKQRGAYQGRKKSLSPDQVAELRRRVAAGEKKAKLARELGRIERTLFALDWMQSVELRRRVHAGLNKGEARNALARAVFFNRLGEIRDRSFEQQRYRASGLNMVPAAIVLWNTVYLERATLAMHDAGNVIDDNLLQYLSPLGWEHINLTGDYIWQHSKKIKQGKFRPLRTLGEA